MFNLLRDIEKAIQKYPSLKYYALDSGPAVAGPFMAHNKERKIDIESYDVLILFTKKYPFTFPLVIETSKKIPRELNRHVKHDTTLCFGNWQDEMSACKNGITLTWFLDEILNTHLCREYVKENTNEYLTGERSHGNEGIWEGYYDVLNIQDKYEVLKELELMLNHKPLGRNAPCYCNNGKKYKACHEKIEDQIFNAGRPAARLIFEFLKDDYEKER